MADIPTTNLDAASDSPAAARVELLQAVQRLNAMTRTPPALGEGAALVTLRDSAGDWVATDLEALAAEIGLRLRGERTIPSGGTLAATVAAYPSAAIALPPLTITASAVQLMAHSLRGAGSELSRIVAGAGAQSALVLGYGPTGWAYKHIADTHIDGNSRASDGVTLGAAASPQVAGRWAIERTVLSFCRRGIYKPAGNIGNTYRNVSFQSSDYGYYAVGNVLPLMHAGNDTFDGCHFDGMDKAGIYIDSPQIGSGGTRVCNSVMEFCPGIPVFVKSWADSFTPLIFDNLWFEGNGAAGTVNINGTNYSTVDMHLEDCRQAVILNGHVPKVRFLNSHVACHDVAMNADATSWAIDSTSTVTVDGANIDGGGHPVVISSVSTIRRQLGNYTSRFQAPPRWIKAGATEATVAASIPFTVQQVFAGTGTVGGTVVADGRSYPTCNELVVPAGFTLVTPPAAVTAGKWYVLTIDLKCTSGDLVALDISFVDTVQICPAVNQLFFAGQWATIGAIGPCGSSGTVRLSITNSSAAASVLRMGAYQLVEFATERRAIEYYNAGFHQ